ncbi:hypothetical protein ACWDYJ_33465 [Streptomyces sp. NPDC003042]
MTIDRTARIHEEARCHDGVADLWPKAVALPGPSQELLDRARVGWERFIASAEGPFHG